MAARDMGVTEFLAKPFTANDLAKRLTHVINAPRDFILSADYFGPCRRRRRNSEFTGPLRRIADQPPEKRKVLEAALLENSKLTDIDFADGDGTEKSWNISE
jgi:hypothetical protein